MTEYIEREALLMALNGNNIPYNGDVNYFIVNAPAADVVEVRHAKWIDNHNGTFTCSACGGKASKMEFCGRCGALMDGKDGEK